MRFRLRAEKIKEEVEPFFIWPVWLRSRNLIKNHYEVWSVKFEGLDRLKRAGTEKAVPPHLYSSVAFSTDMNSICKLELQKDRNELMGCVTD